jgi:hypothetical protein
VKDGQKFIHGVGTDAGFMEGGGQRTLVGVTSDGKMVVLEGSTNFDNAAETLLALGCIDGMAMDGGASSFLYANGETLQNAGRNLNNIVALYGSTAAPETADTPAAVPAAVQAPAPAANTKAVPTASRVFINGQEVSFDAYNIENANYFKLRDLAFSLRGTEKQFDVSFDAGANAISLLPNTPYTVAWGEMDQGDGKTKDAALTSSKIIMYGAEVHLTAYNINNANYFKLRDIGRAFDFSTVFDAGNNAIMIDTSKPYTD